jgi:hypothetical protein
MGVSLGYAGSGSNSTTEPNSQPMARLLRIRKGKSHRALVHQVRAGRTRRERRMKMRAGTKEPDPAVAAIERVMRGLVDRSPVTGHVTTVGS